MVLIAMIVAGYREPRGINPDTKLGDDGGVKIDIDRQVMRMRNTRYS